MEEIGAPVNPSHPDLTVLYCSLRCSGQTFALLEFVAGETLEELVKRSDPASCEREIPLFCRLLDAFESAERNGSGQAAAQPDIDLTDFGVGRAKTSTAATLHGSILVGPDGASSEQVSASWGQAFTGVRATHGIVRQAARQPAAVEAYGAATLGECAGALAGLQSPAQQPTLVAKAQVKRSLLVRTVASPYVIAVAKRQP